jgi:hypothetical protein
MPNFVRYSWIILILLTGCAGPRLALQWVPPPDKGPTTDKSPPNLLDNYLRMLPPRNEESKVVPAQHSIPVNDGGQLPGVQVGQTRPIPPTGDVRNASQFGSLNTEPQKGAGTSTTVTAPIAAPAGTQIVPASGTHLLPVPQPVPQAVPVPNPVDLAHTASSSVATPISIPSVPSANGQPVTATMPIVVPHAITTSVVSGTVRTMPTVLGGALQLGPNDNPLDRMLDLTKQIESRDMENHVLQSRIKSLEATAASRETSLNESLREVETTTSEVAKARNDLATLRKEIQSLKVKLSQAEKDEIETLKLIVEALEKVLQADGK